MERRANPAGGATIQAPADVAELVDAHGSGPCGRKVVEVQVLSSALCWRPPGSQHGGPRVQGLGTCRRAGQPIANGVADTTSWGQNGHDAFGGRGISLAQQRVQALGVDLRRNSRIKKCHDVGR